jgi:hypothetical protein
MDLAVAAVRQILDLLAQTVAVMAVMANLM